MKKKIFAALQEDIHQGWVWLQDEQLKQRKIVKIKNLNNRKIIYCETLQIDKNFLRKYNSPPRYSIEEPLSTLVINEWFRHKLGILKTQIEVDLEITECSSSSWAKFRACTHHPQIIVRVGVWLGFIGAILGVVSLFLGIVSLVISLK